MKEISICNHLICPDCKIKLEMQGHLVCRHCGRFFPISHNQIIDLLPTSLSKADVAEEHFWATDTRQGVNAHPLLSLVHKPIL